jgi:hypothetical protein
MQTDFMAMAQGQAAPAEDELSIVIENITQLGREAGIEQELGPEEFAKQVQELAQLIMDEDKDGTENNKLYQLIMTTIVEAEKMSQQGGTGGPVPQQAQAGTAPTKDFASMMPTPGGGLPGR